MFIYSVFSGQKQQWEVWNSLSIMDFKYLVMHLVLVLSVSLNVSPYISLLDLHAALKTYKLCCVCLYACLSAAFVKIYALDFPDFYNWHSPAVWRKTIFSMFEQKGSENIAFVIWVSLKYFEMPVLVIVLVSLCKHCCMNALNGLNGCNQSDFTFLQIPVC